MASYGLLFEVSVFVSTWQPGDLLPFWFNQAELSHNHQDPGGTYRSQTNINILTHIQMGMDQYLLIPFLVGWTSIYQLFWGSLGTRVLTHPQICSFGFAVGIHVIPCFFFFSSHILWFCSPKSTCHGASPWPTSPAPSLATDAGRNGLRRCCASRPWVAPRCGATSSATTRWSDAAWNGRWGRDGGPVMLRWVGIAAIVVYSWLMVLMVITCCLHVELYVDRLISLIIWLIDWFKCVVFRWPYISSTKCCSCLWLPRWSPSHRSSRVAKLSGWRCNVWRRWQVGPGAMKCAKPWC